jgi:peptide/nickel transport system substrate-binding protein
VAENPPAFFAYAVNFACAYRAAVRDVATHPMRWFDLRRGHIAA